MGAGGWGGGAPVEHVPVGLHQGGQEQRQEGAGADVGRHAGGVPGVEVVAGPGHRRVAPPAPATIAARRHQQVRRTATAADQQAFVDTKSEAHSADGSIARRTCAMA